MPQYKSAANRVAARTPGWPWYTVCRYDRHTDVHANEVEGLGRVAIALVWFNASAGLEDIQRFLSVFRLLVGVALFSYWSYKQA